MTWRVTGETSAAPTGLRGVTSHWPRDPVENTGILESGCGHQTPFSTSRGGRQARFRNVKDVGVVGNNVVTYLTSIRWGKDEGKAMGIELGGCLLGFPVHIRSSGIKVKTARGRRSGPGRGCQPSSWPGAFPDHCFRPKLKHGLTENLSTGCMSGLQRISPHQPLRSLGREASCSD